MAKQPRVWDGSQWQELAVQVPDMSNYAYLPTTPVSGFRNAIINGDFKVWQRGTSFSSVASTTYTADRWVSNYDGTSGTYVISQQAFTAGNPIPNYEPQFFLRYAVTVAGSGSTRGLDQKIEDVRSFAGQTITVSFWAKADTARTLGVQVYQNFGSGGSSEVYTSGTSASLTTTWARYSTTINVPSISGKTIGTNHFLALRFLIPASATPTIDIWGVQVESGSVATPFEQRPIGTELALCQRYYYRLAQNTGRYGAGYAKTTTTADVIIDFPVTMRTNPSALEQSGTAGDYLIAYQNSAVAGSSVPTFTNATVKSGTVNFTVGAVLTAGNGVIAGPNGANSYLGWSAEL